MFPSKAQGFTLVELLIVLVLIGLTSSVVLPNMWQQLEQVQRYSEKKQLLSLLQYARQYTLYTGKALTLVSQGQELKVWHAKDYTEQESETILDSQSDPNTPIKVVQFSYLAFAEKQTLTFSSKQFFQPNTLAFQYLSSQQNETIDWGRQGST